MCGIIAVISKDKFGFKRDHCDLFDNLLYANALRGMDSTGVVLVDRFGNMELAKEASDASTYRRRPEYKALMSRALTKGSVLIGHNRAATRGVINDENAHPFVVDNTITLVHNGTLWGDHKKLADTEVDSHAIAHVIHKHGDDVEAALQEIDGAFALIWHDFKNQTVNIVRNSQRPLHWLECEDCWIYASEMNMIEWVLNRFNKIVPVHEIKSQAPAMLTKFTLTYGVFTPSSKEVKLYKPPVYTPPTTSYKNERYDACSMAAYYRQMEEDEKDFLTDDEKKLLEEDITFISTSASKSIWECEGELARKVGINLTKAEFYEAFDKIKVDGYYAAVVTDFLPLDEENPEQGYYMYAVLEQDTRFLVRQFVPHSDSIFNVLMDSMANSQRVLIKAEGKQYRPYKANQDGGFGLMHVTKVKPLLTLEERVVETEELNA